MPTIWIDTRMNDNVAAGGGTLKKSLMSGVSSTQTRFDRMTLMRTIIGIDVGHFIHDSGEGSSVLAMGIGATSQEAFAAGILADPETETDFPARGWVWRAEYRLYSFAADDPTVDNRRIDLDLRSRRKLENGEMYFHAVNNGIEGVNVVLRVNGYIRQLWLVG